MVILGMLDPACMALLIDVGGSEDVDLQHVAFAFSVSESFDNFASCRLRCDGRSRKRLGTGLSMVHGRYDCI